MSPLQSAPAEVGSSVLGFAVFIYATITVQLKYILPQLCERLDRAQYQEYNAATWGFIGIAFSLTAFSLVFLTNTLVDDLVIGLGILDVDPRRMAWIGGMLLGISAVIIAALAGISGTYLGYLELKVYRDPFK